MIPYWNQHAARCDMSSLICSSKVAAHCAGLQLAQTLIDLLWRHKYGHDAQPTCKHQPVNQTTRDRATRTQVLLPPPHHWTPLSFVHVCVYRHAAGSRVAQTYRHRREQAQLLTQTGKNKPILSPFSPHSAVFQTLLCLTNTFGKQHAWLNNCETHFFFISPGTAGAEVVTPTGDRDAQNTFP